MWVSKPLLITRVSPVASGKDGTLPWQHGLIDSRISVLATGADASGLQNTGGALAQLGSQLEPPCAGSHVTCCLMFCQCASMQSLGGTRMMFQFSLLLRQDS